MKKYKIIIALCLTITVCCCSFIDNTLFPRRVLSSDISNDDDDKLTNKYISAEGKDLFSLLNNQSKESYKEILYIAAGEFHNSKHVCGNTDGIVKTYVMGFPYSQTIAGRRTINADTVFFETTSLSAFVKIGEQRYVNSDSWLTRRGANPSSRGADYTSSKVDVFTKKAYIERYGQINSNICSYIINDFSYLSCIQNAQTSDGCFSLTYSLDPSYACERYKREVKFMGGASDYPSFSSTKLTINIDKNFRTHSIESQEVYSMPIMGGVSCTGYIKESFCYYEEDINIPEESDFMPYFGK